MKILGIIGTPNRNPSGYVVEIGYYELDKLVGREKRLADLGVGSEVEVGDLWNRFHDLENRIKGAGDGSRNLRALADLIDAQVAAITLSKPEPEG